LGTISVSISEDLMAKMKKYGIKSGEVALGIRHGAEGGEDPDPIRLDHV